MTLLRLLYYYLWIVPHVLQVIILVVMIRRKLYRQFPIFLLYTGFELSQFGVLFVLERSRSLSADEYYNVFSLGVAISAALRFGVIYQIFIRVFRNYTALSELGRVLFRWATVVLLLVAVALAAATQGSGAAGSLAVLSILDRTVSILQCGLLMFLFLFSRYFALSWRNYAFGIALGFGIFASVELVTSAIRSQVGLSGADLLDTLVMATYHCCVLIWVFYLVVPERSLSYAPKKLPEHDLEVWNQELQRLLQR
jgi:hypothetical protein